MLQYWLKDSLIAVQRSEGLPDTANGLRILTGSDNEITPGYLYICELETIADILKFCSLPNEPTCIICTSCGNDPVLLPKIETLWIIYSSSDMIGLINQIQEPIREYTRWSLRMKDTISKNTGLKVLLDCAASFIHTDMLLVNAGSKEIALSQVSESIDPLATELAENGYLSFDTIKYIQKQPFIKGSFDPNIVKIYMSQNGIDRILCHRIRYKNEIYARLFLIIRDHENTDMYVDYAERICGFISECMFSSGSVNYISNADFGILVSDLIDFRLTDPVELDERLKQIKLSVKRYYHIVLFSFDEQEEETNIPWNYIIEQLGRIFPYSDITTYHNEILMLVKKTSRGTRVGYDERALTKILKSYGGHAMFGNFSEFLTSLPQMYYQTESTFRIAKAIDPDRSIYCYENYSLYNIAELAYIGSQSELHTQNIVYVCHPALITLLQYDMRHGTDLTEITHEYLKCERNSALAAKRLYVHRNTMLNKVRKIEEVIGESLDDPDLRERLLFSFNVLEYVRKYRKEDILLLRKNRNKAERIPEGK